MKLNKKKKADLSVRQAPVNAPARVGNKELFSLSSAAGYYEKALYEELRKQVPIIDACIDKIIRLAGGFRVKTTDERYQEILDAFSQSVRTGVSGCSLENFAGQYLDSMLTYGFAVAEILYDKSGLISGLYIARPSLVDVREGKTPFEREYYVGRGSAAEKVKDSSNILFASLNATPENPTGVSVLRGLSNLSAILLRIYECIGQNFDRAGNIRYAVTYNPPADSGEKAFAKERAMQIAKEWSEGMAASKNGSVRDFVAVGDVGIKVIGADSPILDTEIPVRKILEQLISKLSIPPFLLGLNWSSTERMSSQQADILTSELEYYRRQITPVIAEIARRFLKQCGSFGEVYVEWDNISLQDETELAKARLYNAQAKEIEIKIQKEETVNG